MLIFCEGGPFMNVKPNIGIIQALIRITCGLTIIAWSATKLVKKPWSDRFLILISLGAMKVAEGIVRYCPIIALFEKGKENIKDSDHQFKPPMDFLKEQKLLKDTDFE